MVPSPDPSPEVPEVPEVPKTTATLTVEMRGAAATWGKVSGDGIDCGATCSITVPINTKITLTQSVQARQGAWFQGWSGGGCAASGDCTVMLTDDLTIAAQFDSVNYMFVTSTMTSTVLGNRSDDVQARADDMCKTAAARAGLPGTRWAAYLSTTSASGSGAKDAGDKIASARGWLRPDGLPFADTPSGLTDVQGEMFYSPRIDEYGNDIGSNQSVATGTLHGHYSDGNCSDFSSTSGFVTGGEAAAGSGGWSYSFHYLSCGAMRMYCFGIDHNTVVVPPKTAGRIAFITASVFTMTAQSSRATADALCQAEADANPQNVPAGTYQALLATSTEAASTRFLPPNDTSMLPWVRPDGVVVVKQPADLFNTSPPVDNLMLSSISMTASGRYAGRGQVWTGAISPNVVPTQSSTCNDWNSSGTGAAVAERYMACTTNQPSYFYYPFQSRPCSYNLPVYCLQVR